MSRLTFVLGGARSGKSTYALNRAYASTQSVLFVATAEARDEEMKLRIANHQAERPAHWKTLEAPSHVGEAIEQLFKSGERFDFVLIDCLTLLASNMFASPDELDEQQAGARLNAEIQSILKTFRTQTQAGHEAQWMIISNEVGLGIIPAYPLGRVYRDVLGRANQQLATEADEVIFLVAGLPMTVK